MNGLLDQGYFTIHITPQPSCSFVSFETNIQVPGNDYSTLVAQVLNVFKPGSFTVTLFGGYVENFSSIAEKTFQSRCLGTRSQIFSKTTPKVPAIPSPKYLRTTQSTYTFENYYELVFAHYEQLNEEEQQKLKHTGCKRKIHSD